MLPSLADKNPLSAMRGCIFGRGGVGKTHLLGTFAKAGRIAIADVDGDGVDTLLGWRFRQTNPWFEPRMVEYEKFNEEYDNYGMPVGDPKAWWRLLAWLNKMLKEPSIKVIAVDSLSAASILAILVGMRANKAKDRSKTWADKDTIHMLLTTQADFGAEMNAIVGLLNLIKRASEVDKHMLLTAHIRENRTKEGTLINIEPLVTGDRLRAQFANYFSDVWYLDVKADPGKQPQRVLITDTTPGIKGVKSRLGVPQLVDPSYEKIMLELRKKYEKPTVPAQVTPPASTPQATKPATLTK